MSDTTGIKPAVLVKSDPPPVVSTGQHLSPGLALGIAFALSLMIAVPLRLRVQRARMDPREMAFNRMARRLRLDRQDRATMRHVAGLGSDSEIEAKVSPAALMLSERAFLTCAQRWISESDGTERSKRISDLQRKVFAPRRKR